MEKFREPKASLTFSAREGSAFKKIIRMVRFTLFCFFLSLLQVMAVDSYSQQTRLTLNQQNQKLEDVLRTIENKSEFFFLYNRDLIDVNQRVNIEVTNQTITAILDKLLKESDIRYSVVNRQIILSNLEGISGLTGQQQKSVSGKITDSSGASLPGVSVVVKGTTNGTITDTNGNYTLSNLPANATLQFSFVGMKTQEVTVGAKSTINVTLVEDAIGIEEVVAVGYGTVKKSDLTGAVSVVKTADLQTSTSPSIGSMLQGRASGLQVIQNSAQPGGGQNFLIRGASSVNASTAPLWVIDGIPYSGGLSEPDANSQYRGGDKSILNNLNPNDIESVEILKDASSTAIYGARASNGVVLITTKRGKEGKTQIQYSGSYSFQNIADNYEVMDASTHMTQVNRYLKEDWMRKNKVTPYGSKAESDITGQFVPKYSTSLIDNPPVNTDWLGAITQAGYTTQHNMTLSGGSKNLKHFISGNYYKQEGIIRTNGLERLTGRVNLEYNLNKYLAAGINIAASQSSFDNVALGSGDNATAGIIRSAIHATPMQLVQDADGNYPLWPEMSFLSNPASLLTVTDKGVTSQLLAIAFIKLNPIENLTFKFNVGFDKGSSTRNQYIPKTTAVGFSAGGKASIGTKFKSDKTFDITADYKFKLGEKHNLNVMAGTSAQYFSYEGSNLSNYGFLLDNSLWYNIGSGSAVKPDISSNGGTSSVASYFGRANYSLLDRYLITGTFRADGASNFAKNHKWGYFPSASVAWKIHNEAFMEPIINIVSQLKLRAGYGLTGNSSIGNRSFAAYGSSVYSNPIIGETQPTAVYAIQLENPDLKWESSKELNIGLDFGFIDNKISGSIEYFNKTTFDLLATRSLLSYNEVNTIVANIGETQSTGFEFSFSTVLNKGDFKWNTSSTFSLYRDRWKERDPAWKPGIYEKPNDYIRTRFSYLSDGLIQVGENVPHMPGSLPGQVKIKDIGGFQLDSNGNPKVDANGYFYNTGIPDGKIDGADIANLGSRDPKYRIGLSNTFRYKKFDLNIYFYGVFGTTLSNPLLSDYWDQISNLGIGKNYPTAFIVDSWTRDNPNGKYPSFFRYPLGYGDYFNEPSWFIRCQNITLGYDLTLPKLNISNIRIFSSLQNPFIITDYKGVDPETDTYPASYPNIRTLTFGVDVKF